METRTEIENRIILKYVDMDIEYVESYDKIIWIGIINITDIKSMLNSKIDLNVNEWVERIVIHVTHIFCNVGSDLLS